MLHGERTRANKLEDELVAASFAPAVANHWRKAPINRK
jgi:hypothetical protein